MKRFLPVVTLFAASILATVTGCSPNELSSGKRASHKAAPTAVAPPDPSSAGKSAADEAQALPPAKVSDQEAQAELMRLAGDSPATALNAGPSGAAPAAAPAAHRVRLLTIQSDMRKQGQWIPFTLWLLQDAQGDLNGVHVIGRGENSQLTLDEIRAGKPLTTMMEPGLFGSAPKPHVVTALLGSGLDAARGGKLTLKYLSQAVPQLPAKDSHLQVDFQLERIGNEWILYTSDAQGKRPVKELKLHTKFISTRLTGQVPLGISRVEPL